MHVMAKNGGGESGIGEGLLMAFVSLLQIVVNVGPKLLQHIPEGVETHLRSPIGKTRRKTTIGGGIIDVGNSDRSGVAGKLGNVEHSSARVSSSDENTANGIFKAVAGGTFAQLKIAR